MSLLQKIKGQAASDDNLVLMTIDHHLDFIGAVEVGGILADRYLILLIPQPVSLKSYKLNTMYSVEKSLNFC